MIKTLLQLEQELAALRTDPRVKDSTQIMLNVTHEKDDYRGEFIIAVVYIPSDEDSGAIWFDPTTKEDRG